MRRQASAGGRTGGGVGSPVFLNRPGLATAHRREINRYETRKETVTRRAGQASDDLRCARCGRFLPPEAFHLAPRMRSGRSSWCRECQVDRNRQSRDEHRDEINGRRRAAYPHVTHPERGCDICGQAFTPRTSRSRFCSLPCRRRRKVDRWREIRPRAGQSVERANEA
jgi:hypothetical protein